MGLKPGTTNNPAGRPRGKGNQITTEMKQFLSDLLDENKEQIRNDLMNTPPIKRLQIFIQLLQYVLPKPTAPDYKTEMLQLELLLSKTPEAYIQAIAEKINDLQTQTKLLEDENKN
jgi:hypothetical protein